MLEMVLKIKCVLPRYLTDDENDDLGGFDP